jgi:hypothetical protein
MKQRIEMSKGMKAMLLRGIRFPSPNLQGIEDDTDFSSFLRARSYSQHNPWPELVNLADPEGLRNGWSNPWLRLLYLPTSQPELLSSGAQGQAPLDLWVGALHEHLHLALDFTPAKEFGRACFGVAYHCVGQLMDEPNDTWNSRVAGYWNTLSRCNNVLEQIVYQISLAEELLVTALSFRAVENQLTTKEEIDNLIAIEALCAANQGKWLQDFENLYYGAVKEGGLGGFKKLVRLGVKPDSPLPSVLAIGRWGAFLETIERKSGSFQFIDRVIDSRERCKQLVEAIHSMEDEGQLIEWLGRVGKDDIAAWRIALGVVAGLSREYPPTGALWALARGRKLHRRKFDFLRRTSYVDIARKVLEEYWNWPAPSIDWARVEWTQVLLYPQERNGRWYITPLPTQGQKIDGEYGALIATEAFRQQLSTGRGILCPFLTTSGRCSCDPDFRRKVNRLARWAMEGRFHGRGDFEELPWPCGSRN